MTDEVPIQAMATFVVRNDKYRGLLIESLETTDGNVYFFKWHDQPLHRHCEQMQNIIIAANVQRTRKMLIDVTEFFTQYFRPLGGYQTEVVFRATKLLSTVDQIDKVYTMKLNKEFGITKRMETIAENKQAKIVAKNRKILSKVEVAEAKFQIERARRINAAQGNHCGGPAPGGGPSQGGATQLNYNQSALPDEDMDNL